MNSGAGCRLHMPGEALCARVTHSAGPLPVVTPSTYEASIMDKVRGRVSLRPQGAHTWEALPRLPLHSAQGQIKHKRSSIYEPKS